ncbi:MAG: hypothetical protein ACOC5T_05435 [Elusimicrobiota bacterium]
MTEYDGYKGEKVHLDCPKGRTRKSRKHGYKYGSIKIGTKQSIYIKKDGTMKTIGKICLNCGKIWLKEEYLGTPTKIRKYEDK